MNNDKNYRPDDESYDEYDGDGYDEYDGADDEYEDERYNRLLDEIADIKRTVTSPAAPYRGTYPYNGGYGAPPSAPYGTNPGGDVAVYNELSRLREELSRAQNAQNMHMELTRLKDEMNKRDGGDDMSKLTGELKQVLGELKSGAAGLEALKKSGLDADTSKRLSELLDKLSAGGDLSDSLRFISEDISDIKETLGIDYEKLLEEMTFLKNRLSGKAASGESDQTQSADSEISEKLDQIKDKLSAFDEYDTVAEILSLREEVKAARIVDQNDVSGELEKLRNSIDAKTDALLNALKSASDKESTVSAAPAAVGTGEMNMLLNEVVSLRDELQAFKDEYAKPETAPAAAEPAAAEDTGAILEELVNLRTDFFGLKEESDADSKALRTELEELKTVAAELKDAVSRRTTLVAGDGNETASAPKELDVVISEIVDIKDELKEESDKIGTRLDVLAEKAASAETAEAVRSEFAAIKEDLEFVKNQLGDLQMAFALSEPDDDAAALREENEKLKAQLAAAGTSVPAAELEAIKEELRSVKAAAEEAAAGLRELRDKPDLSVMREILALRDEYQAMKEKLDKAASDNDGSVKEEIGRLRDQMFAVSMASVGDGSSDKVAYESYNNIILDEISAIRDELTELKKADRTEELIADIASVKEKLAAGDNDAVMSRLKRIEESLNAVKVQTSGDDDISDAFDELKDRLNRISSIVEDKKKDAPVADKKKRAETGDSLISRLSSETSDIDGKK